MKTQKFINSFGINVFVVCLLLILPIQSHKLFGFSFTEITTEDHHFCISSDFVLCDFDKFSFSMINYLSNDVGKQFFSFIKPLHKLGMLNVESFNVESEKATGNKNYQINDNRMREICEEVIHEKLLFFAKKLIALIIPLLIFIVIFIYVIFPILEKYVL